MHPDYTPIVIILAIGLIAVMAWCATLHDRIRALEGQKYDPDEGWGGTGI